MEEQNKPLVSIIVRTKDRPRTLLRAVRSISEQTYRPIEIVLVNDGGCDLDIDALKEAASDLDINYIRLEKNRGRAHAGNVGIESAAGKFAGFLDDDDELYPDHVATLVYVCEQLDVKTAYTDVVIADLEYDPEAGEMVKRNKRIFASRDFSWKALIIDNYIPLMSILFSGELLKKVGGFDETFDLYEDWDLLIRTAKLSPFYHVRKTTAEYLQWDASRQVAQSPEHPGRASAAHIQILEKHKGEFTHEILLELVRNRRELSASTERLSKLEWENAEAVRNLDLQLQEKVAGLEDLTRKLNIKDSLLLKKDALLQEKDGELKKRDSSLKGLKANLEELAAAVRDRDAKIDSLERRIEIYGRHIRDKEEALAHIYRSHGWKMLRSYYRVRDRLLPENSKRRLLAKMVFNVFDSPRRFMKNLNALNARKFFYYLGNSDASILEEKVNRKIGKAGAVNVKPALFEKGDVAAEEASSVHTAGVLLLQGPELNDPHNGLSGMRAVIGDLLTALKSEFEVTSLQPGQAFEEYLKSHGGRLSHVIGFGPEFCFGAFPFVRAYAPECRLIYCMQDVDPSPEGLEYFNAAAADAVVVASAETKGWLEKHNVRGKIGVVEDAASLEALLAPIDRQEWMKVREPDGPVTHHETASDTLRQTGQSSNELKEGSVLVIGIYLAGQANNAEQVIEQFNRAGRWNVKQKWIALGGEPPVEKVRAVTMLRVGDFTPKVVLLNRILEDEDMGAYDYLVVCDDDIILPADFLDRFLAFQIKYDFAVAQPARTHNSYIDHPFVERLDGLAARRTRFVEIGPVVSYRRDIFPFVVPFDESSPMGWGFDYVLPCIAEKHGLRVGIIDATPVDHSLRKPVQNYDVNEALDTMKTYLTRNPHLSRGEAFRILESYL